MKTGKESAFNSLTKMGRLRWRGGEKRENSFFLSNIPQKAPRWLPRGSPGMI
jgi:hypothetical protein